MASALRASAQLNTAACSRVSTRSVAAVKPVASMVSARPSLKAARKAGPSSRSSPVAKVSAVEIAQVANEASFIGGVAGTMWAMTLIGLALGFVLLRVESLVEEGKL